MTVDLPDHRGNSRPHAQREDGMSAFEATDEERAYMAAPMTVDERTATKGMPRMVAHGWVTRHRAHYLATKRGDERKERITEALIHLAEAMQ